MIKNIDFMDAGYCTHPEFVTIKGGRFQTKIYPAMFMHIEHPVHGHILYDTGYSDYFFQETRNFPNKLYALTTPVHVHSDEFAISRLKAKGIEANDINYIIISHFHGDHIAGLRDFPKAKFIYLKSDYEKLKNLRGIKALLNGFLPGLLPKDFENRSIQIDQNYTKRNFHSRIESIFDNTFDILGDGSLIAVDLPGHTSQQMGLYLKSEVKEYFLVADSVWHSRSIRENITPHFITNLIHSNSRKLYETINKLHQLYQYEPHIEYVPSHCGEKFCQHVHQSSLDKSQINGI